MRQDARGLQTLYQRYLEAALRGDATGAANAIEDGLQAGRDPIRLELEVVLAAQVRIGELWHSGEASVAQEHLASQIAAQQMDRLRQELKLSPRLGHRAVVTTPEGELHWLGARLMADWLQADGWEVDSLGAATPAKDLARHVRERNAELVVLGATIPESREPLLEAIEALRGLARRPILLVGGSILLGDPNLAQGLRVDAAVNDPLRALREARRLIGAEVGRQSLPALLKSLGLRIQEFRHARGWSQQQLAEASDLDRTYISALEHGKQNPTLGAVMKLAEALDSSVEALLLAREPGA